MQLIITFTQLIYLLIVIYYRGQHQLIENQNFII